MLQSERFWGWIVFILGSIGYLPVVIGGVKHPVEINVASYAIWFILTVILTYSAYKQHFPGWRMTLGWALGNLTMIVLGRCLVGYSFNLGLSEVLAIYGLAITLALWSAVGMITKRWSTRILFLGSIIADIISYYPQIKQYIEPHETPTRWMIMGWIIWCIGSFTNIITVDRMPQMMLAKAEKPLTLLERSAASLENGFLILFTIFVMTR